MLKKFFFFTNVLGVNKLIVGTIVIYTFFVVLLLKRTPVLLLGSMLVIATIFAILPDAEAAGSVEAVSYTHLPLPTIYSV